MKTKDYRLKSYDFSNLRQKTILDFTDDIELIKKALDMEELEDNELFIKEFISPAENNMTDRGLCFVQFAYFIKNKEFEKQCNIQFKNEFLEYNKLFNE